MNHKAILVIPARMASTRFPGKPLKKIGGVSLIQRVYTQAIKSRHASRVIIATDSREIYDEAKRIGAESVMTSSDHATGTDRVAEVAESLKENGLHVDLIANVQGDLPFINPDVIDRVLEDLASAPSTIGMASVATPIFSEEEFNRPSAVKVVFGEDRTALYFSRSPIPHWRSPTDRPSTTPYSHKHLGLYVFRPETLASFARMLPTSLEASERLEQLRPLAHGVRIRMTIVAPELLSPSIEIDTPEDLERAELAIRNREFLTS